MRSPLPALNCSTAAGSWSGSINGNADTLTITSECRVASTYCASQTTYELSKLITTAGGCAAEGVAGASSCGEGVAITSVSNGNMGCLPQGSSVPCDFSVSTDGHTLSYVCGGTVLTYTK